MRQVYYSLILAQWFKSRQKRGQASFLQEKEDLREKQPVPFLALIDSKNLTNLTSKEWSPQTCFQQYQKSFQDGEYNIKEPRYTAFGQNIRTYFSGGIIFMPGSLNQALDAGREIEGIGIHPAAREQPIRSRNNIGVKVGLREGGYIEEPTIEDRVEIDTGAGSADGRQETKGDSNPRRQNLEFFGAGVNPFIAGVAWLRKKPYAYYLNRDGSTNWRLVWESFRGQINEEGTDSGNFEEHWVPHQPESAEAVRESSNKECFEYRSTDGFAGVDLEHFTHAVKLLSELQERQLERVIRGLNVLGLGMSNRGTLQEKRARIYSALTERGYSKAIIDLLNQDESGNPLYEDPLFRPAQSYPKAAGNTRNQSAGNAGR